MAVVKFVQKEALPRGVWFKIAKRKAIGDGVWRQLEDAVMTIDEAKIKHDAGLAEMCQSRDADNFYQHVLIREKKAESRDFFFMRSSYGFHNRMGV